MTSETDSAFVVNLCGPTDCFPNGIFFNYEDAKSWADKVSKNPEGYVIVPCTVSVKYGLMDSYGDIE